MCLTTAPWQPLSSRHRATRWTVGRAYRNPMAPDELRSERRPTRHVLQTDHFFFLWVFYGKFRSMFLGDSKRTMVQSGVRPVDTYISLTYQRLCVNNGTTMVCAKKDAIILILAWAIQQPITWGKKQPTTMEEISTSQTTWYLIQFVDANWADWRGWHLHSLGWDKHQHQSPSIIINHDSIASCKW